MTLIFCPKCGKHISNFKKEGGKLYGVCNCGHVFLLEGATLKQTLISKEKPREAIAVTKEDHNESVDMGSVTCPYCGGRARVLWYFTPYGDEDVVIVYKCTECKKTFRRGELY
jgi:DNA-directed RNA polymerase subunit M/transcription elongation factor TFIIS